MDNNQQNQGADQVPPFFHMWMSQMSGILPPPGMMPPPPPPGFMPGVGATLPPGMPPFPWPYPPQMNIPQAAPKPKKQNKDLDGEVLRLKADIEMGKWKKEQMLANGGRDPDPKEREQERIRIWLKLKQEEEEKKKEELDKKKAEAEEKARKFAEGERIKKIALEKLEAANKAKERSLSSSTPKAYDSHSRRDRNQSPERVSSSSDAVFDSSKASEIQKILRSKKDKVNRREPSVDMIDIPLPTSSPVEKPAGAPQHAEQQEASIPPTPTSSSSSSAVVQRPPPPPVSSLAALQAAAPPPPPPERVFAKSCSLLGPSTGPSVKLGAFTVVSPSIPAVSEPAFKRIRTDSFSSTSSAATPSTTEPLKEESRKRARKSRFEDASTPSTPPPQPTVIRQLQPPAPSSISFPPQVLLPPPGIVCPVLSRASAPPHPSPPRAMRAPPARPLPKKTSDPAPSASTKAVAPAPSASMKAVAPTPPRQEPPQRQLPPRLEPPQRQLPPPPPKGPKPPYRPPMTETTAANTEEERVAFYSSKTMEYRERTKQKLSDEVLDLYIVTEMKTGKIFPKITQEMRDRIDPRKAEYYKNLKESEMRFYRRMFETELSIIGKANLKANLMAAEKEGYLIEDYEKVPALKAVIPPRASKRMEQGGQKRIPLQSKVGYAPEDPRLPRVVPQDPRLPRVVPQMSRDPRLQQNDHARRAPR